MTMEDAKHFIDAIQKAVDDTMKFTDRWELMRLQTRILEVSNLEKIKKEG